MMKTKGVAFVVVDKEWARVIHAKRVFGHDGMEKTARTITFICRVLSRDFPFGLLVEGLGGFEDRETPLRVMIPWQFVWAITDSELFEKMSPGIGFHTVAEAIEAFGRPKRRQLTKQNRATKKPAATKSE